MTPKMDGVSFAEILCLEWWYSYYCGLQIFQGIFEFRKIL